LQKYFGGKWVDKETYADSVKRCMVVPKLRKGTVRDKGVNKEAMN